MEFNTVNWLVQQETDNIEFQPVQIKKRRCPSHKRKNPDYLTIGQLQKMFGAIDNARDALICFLSFTSGLRRAEVLSLRVKDISWDERSIMLNITKGGERKAVILRPWVMPILKKWIRVIGQDSEYIFPSDEFGKGHLAGNGWYNVYKDILKRAELWIEDHDRGNGSMRHSYTFHTLRHSFCTYMLERGVSPAKVQKMMRHSKLKTTMQHYAHVRDPVATEACDSAFNIGKKHSIISTKELGNELNDPVFLLKRQLVKNKITPEEFKEKVELLKMAEGVS